MRRQTLIELTDTKTLEGLLGGIDTIDTKKIGIDIDDLRPDGRCMNIIYTSDKEEAREALQIIWNTNEEIDFNETEADILCHFLRIRFVIPDC